MLKKRLLVIEDDFDVSEMLHVYFTAQGYEVFNALSGKEGVTMARAKLPDLIMLDVMLPDLDGFDVCKALRTATLTRFIPTIFLTQRDRRADKIAGLELGADDYITKPFDIEELRLRVQGSLRRAGREALIDPRTGLPTQARIRDAEEALKTRHGWVRLTVDLEGFTAFRESYGFVAADELLAFVGHTLGECIASQGSDEDFAGMYSDTRYSVFTFAKDPDRLITSIKSRVHQGVQRFYSFTDRERGYLLLDEGKPSQQRAPLLQVVIARHAPVEKQDTGTLSNSLGGV